MFCSIVSRNLDNIAGVNTDGHYFSLIKMNILALQQHLEQRGTLSVTAQLLTKQILDIYLEWVMANKRAKTYRSYSQCLEQLEKSFKGKTLGHPFLVEKHKQRRVAEKARLAAIGRSLASKLSITD